MLNSAEHEILNAFKYKKYREIQHLSGSVKPRMLFSLLINVKMSTIVGILTFMSRKKPRSAELSMIFYNRGTCSVDVHDTTESGSRPSITAFHQAVLSWLR